MRIILGGDMPVHRLGFGALRLTDGWTGEPHGGRAHAVAVLRRAVELGVTFVDTADSYGLGANEELIAEALHPYPDGIVVATKAGQSRPGPAEWRPLGRPEYLKQQAELSLRRLRVERLDLFQLHRVDPLVPLADQVGALKELQDAGKVRHIGLSEVDVTQLVEARAVAAIASVQNLYHLTDRRHEPVLEYCATHGIAFVPWLPVASGRHALPGGVVADVAAQVGATPVQVSLAWILHRAPVTLPIPGTGSLAHVAENVAAANLVLADDQLKRLDDVQPA